MADRLTTLLDGGIPVAGGYPVVTDPAHLELSSETKLPLSGRETWAGIAEAYSTYTSPLRPSREDVVIIETAVNEWRCEHPSNSLTALLLGMTPDIATLNWPPGSRLIALDSSLSVIKAIWPGDVPMHRWAVCGNCLSMPHRQGSFDIAVGDGSLNAFRYPNGFRAAAEAIRDLLTENGMLIIRCYIRPDEPEDTEEVLKELLEQGIPDINHFKFRLFVAMQDSTEAGSPVRQIYRFLRSRVKEDTLRSMSSWSQSAVNGFELWRNADTVYTFPTLAELSELLSGFFDERLVRFPSYELGQNCPTFLLTRRDS